MGGDRRSQPRSVGKTAVTTPLPADALIDLKAPRRLGRFIPVWHWLHALTALRIARVPQRRPACWVDARWLWQTVTAFWHSVRHAEPLAIGLNCALGATLMRPYIQELARVAGDTFISCYPNAGLPNPMSDTGFDETPEVTSRLLREFADQGLVNIVGGCCRTTPEHIGAIHQTVAPLGPRALSAGVFYPEAA